MIFFITKVLVLIQYLVVFSFGWNLSPLGPKTGGMDLFATGYQKGTWDKGIFTPAKDSGGKLFKLVDIRQVLYIERVILNFFIAIYIYYSLCILYFRV